MLSILISYVYSVLTPLVDWLRNSISIYVYLGFNISYLPYEIYDIKNTFER